MLLLRNNNKKNNIIKGISSLVHSSVRPSNEHPNGTEQPNLGRAEDRQAQRPIKSLEGVGGGGRTMFELTVPGRLLV